MIKPINLSVLVLSALGLLLSLYISNEDTHYHISSEEVVEEFDRQLSVLESDLKETLLAKQAFSSFDIAPFAVSIWNRDTLVYWNYEKKIEEYGWHKDLQIDDNRFASISRFEVFSDRSFIDKNICKVPLVFSTFEREHSHDLKGIGSFLSYETSPKHKNRRGQYISLISFLILCSSILYILVQKIKSSLWLSTFGVLVFGAIGILLPIESYTQDIIASKILTNDIFGGLTTVDLLIITLVTLAMAGVLGLRAQERKPSGLLIVCVGLISSLGLLGILKLAKELASHPSIQLEIDKIFKFDKYSVTILICLALITLAHLVANIYFFSDTKTAVVDKRKTLPYFILGVILSTPVFFFINLSIPFVLLYVYMISFYTMIDLFVDTQRKNITWLIWWILILSAFLSIAIFHIGVSKSRDIRKEFVNSFFKEVNAKTQENVVDIDSIVRASDLFEQLASPPFQGVKFDREDMTTYIATLLEDKGIDLDSAQLSLEGFDQYSNSIFSNHFAFENQMEQSVLKSKRVADFVFYNAIDQEYILSYEIIGNREDATKLYVRIDYGNKEDETIVDVDFNYVVYKNKRAIYSRLAAQDRLDPSQLIEAMSNSNKIKGYEANISSKDGMSVIAYKKISALIKPISLFSYLFTLIGILILLFTIVNSRYGFLRAPIDIKITNRSSLRNRIQLVVILLILFSFIVIGLLTSYYFNNVIINTNKKTITEQTVAIVNNINSTIRPATDNNGAFAIMHNKLDEIATIHNKTLALYTLQGDLYSSSKANAFDHRLSFSLWKNIVGSKNPVVEQGAINKDMSRTFIPLYHNNNKSYAVLSINHDSNLKTSKNLLDFLSTILNIYVFLFLLAGAIAIIIANSITRPLTVLGQKLKDFKLGRRNEPLEWKSKDEIGELIQDYNNLIVDLEKSADVIAMTERDTAWREMAKQVAHEIKNPLTPMKLSIQYLERAIQGGGDNEALIKRVSSTLIEQIDNLTQIANEFSNFASMPMASNEKLLLNDIVEMIHELFRKREDMDISLTEPITDLYVYADKNHLIRILNNILKNAIQAIPTDRRGRIKISLYKQENSAIVRVEDNGSGISNDKKDKVFTPNFTTKSSGTGLGLAISVNMIEAFNGSIYFETELDKGTSFFVEVPLMRLGDTHDGKMRVTLD